MNAIKIKLGPFALLGEGTIILVDKNGQEVALELPINQKTK